MPVAGDDDRRPIAERARGARGKREEEYGDCKSD
jgi:hypothetical protein